MKTGARCRESQQRPLPFPGRSRWGGLWAERREGRKRAEDEGQRAEDEGCVGRGLFRGRGQVGDQVVALGRLLHARESLRPREVEAAW